MPEQKADTPAQIAKAASLPNIDPSPPSGKEDASGDEADQTGDRRQAIHDLCSSGVVKDFSGQGIHWINEEIQKAKALEGTPEDEENAHHFGCA